MSREALARELKRYIMAQREQTPGEPTGESEPEPEKVSGETTDTNNSDQPEQLLDELRESARGCTLCGLKENRTQVVFDQGSTRARVMAIGEAPGEREDEQGVPFVGKSGELLRLGFEKVGLQEEDLYITNTVKCRPPGNRDPESEELEACRPYLDQQLEYIDPPVILTLGSFALQYCLGKDRRITRSRGEVYEWEGRKLVPTFHPGYILRNQSAAQDFLNDLARASKLL